MDERDGRTLWTLDELTERVGAALAVDYEGAPTGRVRDVPDQRAIRWYVTRGLVDRPAGMRGRIALYGRRHLLQLVAIKRRQAEGRSLAEIQAELAGATDAALAVVARLPGDAVRPAPRPARVDKFWATRLDAAMAAAVELSADAFAGAADDAAAAAPPGSPPARTKIVMREAPDQPAGVRVPTVDVVHIQALRLAPGITLLIDDGAADPAAVAVAAQPLLDLLAAPGGGVRSEEKL